MIQGVPKEKGGYVLVEPTKVTIVLGTILIGLLGWFGNVLYSKLISIESDVKILLIASSSQGVEINNIKERNRNVDSKQGNKDKSFSFVPTIEFILPEKQKI